jgi:hypothetical protein
MDLLSEFDFEIKHIKGKENRVVDALSRSMKTIHLVAVSTWEIDVKERVRNAEKDRSNCPYHDHVPTMRTCWSKI